jgi:hypothetical protein
MTHAKLRRESQNGRYCAFYCLLAVAVCLCFASCDALTSPLISNPNTLPSTINDGKPPTNGTITPATTISDPGIAIAANPVFCCNPRSIIFEAITTDTLQFSSTTFHWSFGDGRFGSGPRVEHTYSWPGQYLVELEATQPDGTFLTALHWLTFDDVAIPPDDGDDADADASPDPDEEPETEGSPDEQGGLASNYSELRCMVNLSSYALSYPLDRWAGVPVTTDIAVPTTSTSTPHLVLSNLITKIQTRNPHALFGTYISGGRIESSFAQYPPETVAARLIPTEWLLPDTNRINLRNRLAASTFADLIIQESVHRPGHILFVDNIIHPSSLPGWIPWQDTCWFLSRIRDGLVPSKKRLIANIAVSAWGLSDADVQIVTQAVDGISLEMPFHALARGHRERTQRLIDIYRIWLDEKKYLVLIPVAPLATRHKEAELIAGLAMILREPGDRIYVAWPFFQETPHWTNWPEDFGEPDGSFTFEGSNLQRHFANATIKVDPVRSTVLVLPRR